MPKFTYDCTLAATFTVEASTEAEARAHLIKALDCADANVGAQPNGDPLLGEVSLERRLSNKELAIDLVEEEEPYA